jgi:hypothetical protein
MFGVATFFPSQQKQKNCGTFQKKLPDVKKSALKLWNVPKKVA